LYSNDESLESASEILETESVSAGEEWPMILGVKTEDGCETVD